MPTKQENNRRYYYDNPEANVERVKEWRRNNRDWCNENQRQWAKNKPEKHLLYAAKQRAKKLGLPFNITEGDIVIPEVCPVLGIPLLRGDSTSTFNSPSLDRIVPALGYVRGNIAVISKRANSIKNDANADELRKVAAWIDAMSSTLNQDDVVDRFPEFPLTGNGDTYSRND
jgi:hypothetical protein